MINSKTKGRTKINKSKDSDMKVQPQNKDGFSTVSMGSKPKLMASVIY
ncbi:MAG: hypothetical protein WC677_08395 [Clostridia bacterium]